ncbi:stalk domain-containing protein [Aneurinibacillus terranovensis]|uniref:stalk domain-containing protein n=1 Tax=Aneurinibacillus terranovensis TaxID=278991 RepID=UPI0004076B62|nr:stalk domain-containing protein [Aneurinibacillus terranovensis]
MKGKALIILATLSISGVAFASGNIYMGKYPVANVRINGASLTEEDTPAITLNNKTMIPLQTAAEKMGAFVDSDENTGEMMVTKPNINMIVAGEIARSTEGNYQINSPFMAVPRGKTASFDVFVEVDNAPKADMLVFKVVVRGPNGSDEYVSYPQSYSTTRNGTAFLYTHNVKQLQFKQSGDYKVQLIMKEGNTGDYRVVGENIIHSQ